MSDNQYNQPPRYPNPNLELQDAVRAVFRRVKRFLRRPGGLLPLILAVLAAIALWTAYYTVPSDSVAIVQRFGRYLKEVPPGLHFKIPLGVDVATIVPVKRQLKQEFGFVTPGAPTPLKALTRKTNSAKRRWSLGI